MKYPCIVLLMALLTGCVSEFSAKLPDTDSGILVFEGNIAGNSELNFYLSKTIPLGSELPEDYNGVQANIVVVGDNGYRSEPAQYLGTGHHRLQMGVLEKDVAYGIEIQYNEQTYRSVLEKPWVTPEIDSISWVQPEEYGKVSIRVSTHDESVESRYFLWNYVEDWEIASHYRATYIYDPVMKELYEDESAPYHYCWYNKNGTEILIGSGESSDYSRIVNQQLLEYESSNQKLSLLYRIKLRQMAISKAAHTYYENKRKYNNEMGGLFTPQPTELESNIVCTTNSSLKVIGYVNVAYNTTEKVMYIANGELSIPFRQPPCELSKLSDLLKEQGGPPLSADEAYRAGFRPVMFDPISGDLWSSGECADCRYYGGTKNKPEGWPNNHQ